MFQASCSTGGQLPDDHIVQGPLLEIQEKSVRGGEREGEKGEIADMHNSVVVY